MQTDATCPHCGRATQRYRNPFPTVDIIIRVGREIVLIERCNPPHGWALPGGFVDYGETLEEAAIRESREETGLDIRNLRQFHVYSDPQRDPRQHNISVVFTADADGVPSAGDDARNVGLFSPESPPAPLCFDHADILNDYVTGKK